MNLEITFQLMDQPRRSEEDGWMLQATGMRVILTPNTRLGPARFASLDRTVNRIHVGDNLTAIGYLRSPCVMVAAELVVAVNPPMRRYSGHGSVFV